MLGMGIDFSTIFDSAEADKAGGNSTRGATMLRSNFFDRGFCVEDCQKFLVFCLRPRTSRFLRERALAFCTFLCTFESFYSNKKSANYLWIIESTLSRKNLPCLGVDAVGQSVNNFLCFERGH